MRGAEERTGAGGSGPCKANLASLLGLFMPANQLPRVFTLASPEQEEYGLLQPRGD